ncbi:MAG TPA: Crp/Fnr family transcriptional regulator [Syntrophales bacterium]|nr:Crp/Fnr family transcriptional regulator [Syntrophales bacterium]
MKKINPPDHVGIYSSIPLFQSLNEEQRRALDSISARRSFKKGQKIFLEGEKAAGFYIVLSGRVKVFKSSAGGREQILRFFEPGDSFGEVPMFTGGGFPASAESCSETSVLFLSREGFVALIRDNPSLAMNMLAVLSKRLHQLSAVIEDLSLREIPGRLAAHLLFLDRGNDGGEMDLDLPKGELARLLGTIPETLSRILGRMVREGLIRLKGQKIIILDRGGVEEIAVGTRKLS